MKNLLYVVPNLKKVSGGPKTRITCLKKTFKEREDKIIENGNKTKLFFNFQKVNISYIESATNRISLIDVLCLFFLRLRSKKVIIFIRDIYIELFPEEYQTKRSKITLIFNQLSNFYLSLMATHMVFPTKQMGKVFFEKNKRYLKRPYDDLPPGTYNVIENKTLPDFTKKLGILYLGSTKYKNSGFNKFLAFEKLYREEYYFYILSGDKQLSSVMKNTSIKLAKVSRDTIPDYIEKNNIAYAFHPRPRNLYDDLTYPIKVFDFLSFQLPFITEKHKPLEILLSNQYALFASMNDLGLIHQKIETINLEEYTSIVDFLKEIALQNTYKKRYAKLLEI